ncbi:cellulase family glycosylhydrolase [Frankia sp. R82]|uniref:cellulase family glycosylhydrolase n=1 Tax=Frankia sp. R82 TaxID=2950553 RepID=UPI0020440E4D|nr:cellulase family glycosylhydrolase [Frankia sp. R82]MCM3887279.1 cellulase family glycosylhydrolase [Frankia sp. R82]
MVVGCGLLGGCLWPDSGGGTRAATPSTPPADQFVTRAGSALQLAGRPFRFVGFNVFDAAATAHYKCAWWSRRTDAELTADFRYMRDRAGATVVRFWAFQPYTRGGTDFSGMDRVIRSAQANGMRVIPVLENQWRDCTTSADRSAKSAYQGDTWYTQGYQVPYGNASISYRDYVSRIVEHYRDEPTILAWMMMNEAETKARDSQNRSALVGFADDIGHLIKSIDPHHLVTLGTQSNGAPGASGPDFAAVYSLPSLDLAEVHDWATRGSDTEAMPGSVADRTLPAVTSPQCARTDGAPLACSFANTAATLHKPLIVGESGIAATDGATRSRRADLIAAKMQAAFQAGASGYLVWQFNNVVDTQNLDVLPTTEDPLFAAMQKKSENPSG